MPPQFLHLNIMSASFPHNTCALHFIRPLSPTIPEGGPSVILYQKDLHSAMHKMAMAGNSADYIKSTNRLSYALKLWEDIPILITVASRSIFAFNLCDDFLSEIWQPRMAQENPALSVALFMQTTACPHSTPPVSGSRKSTAMILPVLCAVKVLKKSKIIYPQVHNFHRGICVHYGRYKQ